MVVAPDGDAGPRDDVGSCGDVEHETVTPAVRTSAAIRITSWILPTAADDRHTKMTISVPVPHYAAVCRQRGRICSG